MLRSLLTKLKHYCFESIKKVGQCCKGQSIAEFSVTSVAMILIVFSSAEVVGFGVRQQRASSISRELAFLSAELCTEDIGNEQQFDQCLSNRLIQIGIFTALTYPGFNGQITITAYQYDALTLQFEFVAGAQIGGGFGSRYAAGDLDPTLQTTGGHDIIFIGEVETPNRFLVEVIGDVFGAPTIYSSTIS